MFKPLLALCLAATAFGLRDLELKRTSPGNGEILEDPPLKVLLTFSEPVRADSSVIIILHRDSTDFLHLEVQPTAQGEVIEASLPRKLLGAHYLVRWRAVSVSGHVLSGMYPFVVDIPE